MSNYHAESITLNNPSEADALKRAFDDRVVGFYETNAGHFAVIPSGTTIIANEAIGQSTVYGPAQRSQQWLSELVDLTHPLWRAAII